MKMYGYEEDFYNEPSEFDIAVTEFKQYLMKSVKENFVSEMDRLRKENKELQGIKANLEAVKQDFENKKRQLESEYQTLKSNVRRERLVDLTKDHKVILYRAYSKHILPQKCNKCDTNRRIEYISPLGRKAREDCLCKEGKSVYYPHEFIRYEFKLNRDKNGVTAWYRQYSDDDDGFVSDSSIHVKNTYSPDMKFDDLNQYNTFFKTEEECQNYCDWLNAKE